MVSPFRKITTAALFAGLAISSSSAISSDSDSYQVTITNITNSINFTPILVTSHRRKISLFELGSPASSDLSAIAEGGDTSGLAATLASNPGVIDIQSSGGLLGPGQSVTLTLSAAHGAKRISIASMMLPTNDGFIALDSVKAPRKGSVSYFSQGYDAGTEANDELCVNIPGPTCGGTPFSPGVNAGDEGYVHIHRGTQGIGDLSSEKDWRNPVAKITIQRIENH
ncbi:MAG: hypothetical protein GY806_17895 [Gammaproteobacteria bacterium]|nr:hypothetical protein [Gammaproteobacteria bacterium]